MNFCCENVNKLMIWVEEILSLDEVMRFKGERFVCLGGSGRSFLLFSLLGFLRVFLVGVGV